MMIHATLRNPWPAAVWGMCFFVLAVFAAPPVMAEPALCDAAARDAARETGVPVELLLTLTRVETGRGGVDGAPEPWPWTLNMGGDGSWHDSPAAALSAAQRAIAAGSRNVDIGCFQINYRWHGHSFPSLEAMMDPRGNALYAAHFLGDLYGEFGNWIEAVGVFHSRNPVHSARYLARFHEIRAALQPLRPTDGGRRGHVTGPSPLAMAARPALIARPALPMRGGARPLLAPTARPLWEIR